MISGPPVWLQAELPPYEALVGEHVSLQEGLKVEVSVHLQQLVTGLQVTLKFLDGADHCQPFFFDGAVLLISVEGQATG